MAFLEAGKIVGTHGVRGEVRIQPWADSPDFFARFEWLYIDGAPIKLLRVRVHKSLVIAAFDGVFDIDGAIKLKGKVVSVARDDVKLEDGRHFVVDLVGLRAVCDKTGQDLGTVAEILDRPAHDIYVIRGEREILIPAVPEFVKEVNTAGGFITFRLIEGM